MKKLSHIVTTAFLALSLGFSPMACSKKDEFNLRQTKEVTMDTKIDVEGIIPLRSDLIETEKEYAERGMERQFYGITSNKEAFIELMLFKNKEKKMGEEKNYAYISFCGTVGKETWDTPGNKYRIEDKVLAVSSDLDEFKKDLEEIECRPSEDFCWDGHGRSFTIYEDVKDEKGTKDDFLYFGLKLRNLETDKIEYLVYAVRIIDKDSEGNPVFRGYSNGTINYQDTDNDPIPSVIVKSEGKNGGRR